MYCGSQAPQKNPEDVTGEREKVWGDEARKQAERGAWAQSEASRAAGRARGTALHRNRMGSAQGAQPSPAHGGRHRPPFPQRVFAT